MALWWNKCAVLTFGRKPHAAIKTTNVTILDIITKIMKVLLEPVVFYVLCFIRCDRPFLSFLMSR